MVGVGEAGVRPGLSEGELDAVLLKHVLIVITVSGTSSIRHHFVIIDLVNGPQICVHVDFSRSVHPARHCNIAAGEDTRQSRHIPPDTYHCLQNLT